MLAAAWVLAGFTGLIGVTSFIAVVTWRENRRREREDQQAQRILEAARKEFSAKGEVGDLKGNLTAIAAIGVIVGGLILASKYDATRQKLR